MEPAIKAEIKVGICFSSIAFRPVTPLQHVVPMIKHFSFLNVKVAPLHWTERFNVTRTIVENPIDEKEVIASRSLATTPLFSPEKVEANAIAFGSPGTSTNPINLVSPHKARETVCVGFQNATTTSPLSRRIPIMIRGSANGSLLTYRKTTTLKKSRGFGH
jgi:hypothetical protein